MNWSKVVGGALAAVVVLIAQAMAASDSPGFQPTDETPENLPAGKGRDETFYLCTACHGTALVTAQGMRRDQWDETLTWMEEKHKMPPPDAETRDLVLDYLAATFPPRAPQQRGWVNPFSNR
jgi:hypothetical protein